MNAQRGALVRDVLAELQRICERREYRRSRSLCSSAAGQMRGQSAHQLAGIDGLRSRTDGAAPQQANNGLMSMKRRFRDTFR